MPTSRAIVEPRPHLADDLTALRGDPTVDVSSFQKYAVPANPPPLLLSQVPRSERTQLTLTLDDSPQQPTLQHLPSVPVAVLQAPPLVEGLGQQEDFTPTFAARSTSGSSTSQGKSTRLGSHVGFEMTATIGSGGGGSHIRAGGGGSVSFDFMNEVEESIDREVGGLHHRGLRRQLQRQHRGDAHHLRVGLAGDRDPRPDRPDHGSGV